LSVAHLDASGFSLSARRLSTPLRFRSRRDAGRRSSASASGARASEVEAEFRLEPDVDFPAFVKGKSRVGELNAAWAIVLRVLTPVLEGWSRDLVLLEEYGAGSNGPPRH
jgi:hypothetical protein